MNRETCNLETGENKKLTT